MPSSPDGLREQFQAWLGSPEAEDRTDFFRSGLIVFDTSALLSLYSVDPSAREQLVNLLTQIQERIWIPHQVGLEFAKNREAAARSRSRALVNAKKVVQNAEKAALRSLEAAIETVLELRASSMIDRLWDRAAAKVDTDSLRSRLEGAMAPVIAELDTLNAEQDRSIKDVSRHDPVLEAISPLFAKRIGPAYSSTELRAVVNEAIEFRYPNRIPPGYHDKGKSDSVRHAGDYVLWRQLIDMARKSWSTKKVVFVTNDAKPDWWEMDDNGNAVRPHRELVQEIRDQAGADVLILNLTDFVTQARDSLSIEVSADTVDQVRGARSVEERDPDAEVFDFVRRHGLQFLSSEEFEILAARMLEKMGFKIISRNGPDSPDFIARKDRANEPYSVAVMLKDSTDDVDRTELSELSEWMRLLEIERGIIFSNSLVSLSAQSRARRMSIDVISGPHLQNLVHKYFGDE